MSSSTDIRTTRYTIKANVETTRYFKSPLPNIDQQVTENTQDIKTIQTQLLLNTNALKLKENITDHNEDIAAINKALTSKESKTEHAADIATITTNINTKENISDHNYDITTLRGIINTKESSEQHNSDISALKYTFYSALNTKESTEAHKLDFINLRDLISLEIQRLEDQINAIVPGTSYEGLYSFTYSGTSAILNYNYGLGNLIFWDDNNGAYITAINNYDNQNHIQINNNTNSLILQGIIKNTNNTLIKIIYEISAPTNTSRLTLNNLKMLTVLPSVYKIDFTLNGAPNLENLNLFDGLQVLKLNWPSGSVSNNRIRKLRVPRSVNECILTNIAFEDLIIESDYYISLKLQMDGVNISNTFECKCSLTDVSFIKNTYQYQRLLPIDLKLSHNVLWKIDQSVFYNNRHILSLYFPMKYNTNTMKPTLPYSMAFKVIFNYTNYESKLYDSNNLHASTWIGA